MFQNWLLEFCFCYSCIVDVIVVDVVSLLFDDVDVDVAVIC